MDLVTAAAVLVAQAMEVQSVASTISRQAEQIRDLASVENSVPEINPQIKAIVASADANMVNIGSQTVLLQNVLDEIARIVSQ